MAKKKAKYSSTSEADSIISSMKGIARRGSELVETETIVIPVSPAHDAALGGGIPEGSFVVFSGLEKCGKTTTALQFGASAQREEFGGRNVYHGNVEQRLKSRDLKGIAGLNLDKFITIGSIPCVRDEETGEVIKPARILNATEHLEAYEQILRDDPGCVLIIDSVSMLLTEGEQSGSMGDFQRADTAKLLHKFCRRNAGMIQTNKSIVIAICHLMMNQNPKGKKYIPKGGMGIAYQADVNIQCTYFTPWEESKDGKPVGQETHWSVITAALQGGIPGTKYQSYLRYGIGLDSVYELVKMGLDLGLIGAAGKPWFECTFLQGKVTGKIPKFQGEAKLTEKIRENPEWVEALQAAVKELFQ